MSSDKNQSVEEGEATNVAFDIVQDGNLTVLRPASFAPSEILQTHELAIVGGHTPIEGGARPNSEPDNRPIADNEIAGTSTQAFAQSDARPIPETDDHPPAEFDNPPGVASSDSTNKNAREESAKWKQSQQLLNTLKRKCQQVEEKVGAKVLLYAKYSPESSGISYTVEHGNIATHFPLRDLVSPATPPQTPLKSIPLSNTASGSGQVDPLTPEKLMPDSRTSRKCGYCKNSILTVSKKPYDSTWINCSAEEAGKPCTMEFHGSCLGFPGAVNAKLMERTKYYCRSHRQLGIQLAHVEDLEATHRQELVAAAAAAPAAAATAAVAAGASLKARKGSRQSARVANKK